MTWDYFILYSDFKLLTIQDMTNEKCINENNTVNKDLITKAKDDIITKYDADRAYKHYLLDTLKNAEGNILNKININESRIIKVSCEELLREFNVSWSPM